MAHAVVRRLAWASIVMLGISAHAQTVAPRAPADSENAAMNQAASAAAVPEGTDLLPPGSVLDSEHKSLLDRFWAAMSQQEDPDGPINTDRPTFTPANTVVPRGRLQFESGFTFSRETSSTTRANLYDLPELAMRYGLVDRVEFRTFWFGETFAQGQPSGRSRGRISGGLSNMEIGFKWQLLPNDTEKKWRPTTALITSIFAPTGGNSPFSSETVEPYINLIYAWSLSDKLSLGGSTGYLGMTQQPTPGSRHGNEQFQRYHQSIVAFYSVTERSTLFYEWYVLTFTNATDNLPTHFMDGGILYRPTANTQFDLRAGFGLSGRPDDFFTGAGFSVRF
jgi:hypothetical protein